MDKEKNVHLNFARGAAALLVMVGHVRCDYFVVGNPWEHQGIGWIFLDIMTRLQGRAVIVFFVLSGYLVGGSVLQSFRDGRWSWIRYSFQRITRLWVALIPALYLTMVLDILGKLCVQTEALRFADDTFKSFISNLFFLQMFNRLFGSNGPLWSLGYEAWFYLMFPVAWWSLRRSSGWGTKAFGVLVLAVAGWGLPLSWWVEGVVWLFGVLAAWCLSRESWRNLLAQRLFFFCSILVFGYGFFAIFFNPTAGQPLRYGYDILLGLGFAGMTPTLVASDWKPAWYSRLSSYLAEMSYTLYLTHYPVQVFILYVLLRIRPVQPTWGSFPEFLAILFVVLLVARGMWYQFERRTPEIRAWIWKALHERSRVRLRP